MSEGSKEGQQREKSGILTFITVLTTVFLMLALGQYLMKSVSADPFKARLVCRMNLNRLESAMEAYASENDDNYPTADKWCDLLIEGGYASEEMFVCPGSRTKPGQSSYALNKNVVGWKASDIPIDFVLLFETTPGWNQAGGIEILTRENHRGDGCNILHKSWRADSVIGGADWVIGECEHYIWKVWQGDPVNQTTTKQW